MKLTKEEKTFLILSLISFVIVLFYFPYFAKNFISWYLFISAIFLTWTFNNNPNPNRPEIVEVDSFR